MAILRIMHPENCYLCDQPLPQGQSFYEGQGQTICLSCFQTHERCARCRFPGRELLNTPPHGKLCEFCRQSIQAAPSEPCALCDREIQAEERHYEGQGEKVCARCFNSAPERCFTCRFPQISRQVTGVGGVCRHCVSSAVSPLSDLNQLLAPIHPFVQGFGHNPKGLVKGVFLPPLLVLGMQDPNPPPAKIQFLDEFVQFALPVYYLQGVFYLLPILSREWFIPAMAGQLASRDLCRKYNLKGLTQQRPFERFARSWSLFLSQQAAKKLGFAPVEKRLLRHGEHLQAFTKLYAMSEHRPLKEVIRYGQAELSRLASKGLRF